MSADAIAHGVDLFQVAGLLAAGVIAVPIFRRLGLGSVLGYLAAGLAVGPFGLMITRSRPPSRCATGPNSMLRASAIAPA